MYGGILTSTNILFIFETLKSRINFIQIL